MNERASVAETLGNPIVCDLVLPWFREYLIDDVTLPHFKRAGVDFVSLTVSIPENSLNSTIRHITTVKAYIASCPKEMIFVTTADQIAAAKAAGKLAVGFHFQEPTPFEGNIEMVRIFADLGVRHVILAYNLKNAVGDGCAERTDAGLSRYGIRLIGAMNAAGMIVDGSHTGYRTTMEAMEICANPFIFSHSNAFAVNAHYRNIKDDQIRACARTGGIISVNGVNEFLGDLKAETETIFRHVDYIANLVGPEHVGIGLDHVKDYDSVWSWMQENPDLWPDNRGTAGPDNRLVAYRAPDNETTAGVYPAHAQPEQILELGGRLLEAGYSSAHVKGILGENYLRVLRAHERVAAHQAAA